MVMLGIICVIFGIIGIIVGNEMNSNLGYQLESLLNNGRINDGDGLKTLGIILIIIGVIFIIVGAIADSNKNNNRYIQYNYPNNNIGSVACTRCGTINSADTSFCMRCGNQLVYQQPVQPVQTVQQPDQPAQPNAGGIKCTNCGAVIAANSKFCSQCGKTISNEQSQV